MRKRKDAPSRWELLAIIRRLEAQNAKLAKRVEQQAQRIGELDGIYVVRTSEPAERLSPEDTVRGYKRLAQVERAFRCLKGLDLRVRPIRHRTEAHVRAHVFLCVLAYYVEWHLCQAWAELLFEDEERTTDRAQRDPVAPARPSASARQKKRERTTAESLPVQSWETLPAHLATRARHTCRLELPDDPVPSPTFQQLTEPTPLQARAGAPERVPSTGKRNFNVTYVAAVG